MRQFLYSILFIGLLGVSKNSQAQNSAATADKNVNVVNAEISGDETKSIKVSGGESVGLGFLKFTKTTVGPITISGTVTAKDGTTYKVSVVTPLNLQTGVEQIGGFGSYAIENDTKTKTYSNTLYQTYFDTDSKGANSQLHVTLNQITDTGKYIKVTGKFHFNAAYDPNPDSLKGKSETGGSPMFNGAVRGSKKVNVNSSFTVYLLKLLQDK